GLPTATTRSPTRSASDSPTRAVRSEMPSASTASAARSSAGARRTTRALRRRPPATVTSAVAPGTPGGLVVTRPSRAQVTPEPAEPREPRTSTTLRASSLVSSASAPEICAALLATSRTMGVTPFSVGAWGGDHVDVDQGATAYQLDWCWLAHRGGAKGHL